MNKRIKQQHSIDTVFLLVVFMLFAFSGAVLLVLGAGFYQSTVAKNEENDSARIAVAYVREVLHHNDSNKGISIAEFHGTPCFRLPQGENYVLYLYYYNGELKELYTKEGAEVTREDGQKILSLRSFSIEETAAAVWKVQCQDLQGNTEQILISQKSDGRSVSDENTGE